MIPSTVPTPPGVQSVPRHQAEDVPAATPPTATFSGMPVEVIEQGRTGIEFLPEELVLHIFRFLSPENQGRASCVCWKWQHIAADDSLLLTTSNLKERYPLMQVLDEKVCKTHFGALGLDLNAPLLKRKMILELDRLYASVQNGSLKIEGNAGITLAYLPPGLTFNMLTQGYPDTFEYVWDRISTEFGDIAAEGDGLPSQTTLLKAAEGSL